jgi:acyl-coenzyme A synthetase/AMP-(fatty) acid ligase
VELRPLDFDPSLGRLAVRQDDGEWLVTNDVLERDEQGRYWFVDSLSGFVGTSDGPVSLRRLEDALYTLPEVRLAVASVEDGQIVIRYTSAAPIAEERLPKIPHARIERVDAIALTEGFRPRRR